MSVLINLWNAVAHFRFCKYTAQVGSETIPTTYVQHMAFTIITV